MITSNLFGIELFGALIDSNIFINEKSCDFILYQLRRAVGIKNMISVLRNSIGNLEFMYQTLSYITCLHRIKVWSKYRSWCAYRERRPNLACIVLTIKGFGYQEEIWERDDSSMVKCEISKNSKKEGNLPVFGAERVAKKI